MNEPLMVDPNMVIEELVMRITGLVRENAMLSVALHMALSPSGGAADEAVTLASATVQPGMIP